MQNIQRAERKTPYNMGFASGGAICKLEVLCLALRSPRVDRTSSRQPRPNANPQNVSGKCKKRKT